MSSNLRQRRFDNPGQLSEPLLHRDFEDDSDTCDNQGGFSLDQGKRRLSLEAVAEAIVYTWNCLVAGFGQCLVGYRAPPGILPAQLTLLQEEKLNKLRDSKGTTFDPSNPEHEAALRRLWRLSFPSRQLEDLKSEQWKDMGWQGTDPSTDFRGAGFLALENLLYFAETYPSVYSQLLGKVNGRRSEWEYPFCVAGVNLTFAMIEILDVADGRQPRTRAGTNFFTALSEGTDNAFEEVYCAAFQLLDSKWLEMRASYMEFPAVMGEVKKELQAALERAETLGEVERLLLGQEGHKLGMGEPGPNRRFHSGSIGDKQSSRAASFNLGQHGFSVGNLQFACALLDILKHKGRGSISVAAFLDGSDKSDSHARSGKLPARSVYVP
eukprot:CAMPEP_0177615690 /NCGR_PEP_ID=MMETSP0419_2-20121207/23625_1 /TAXON_ID=582737 /ORGANISM="Tetraselmis sp., Strain GSL018" /LENGTH=380 /DNA_ID=CAMNT_0019113435 /DNA_START=69 /DNA_END=1212 /DNA_ORIENTATION=+